MPETPAADDTLRAALHGVRGLLLDLDGVLVLAGKAVPGAPEALAELDRRAFPYLVVTNTSLVSRRSLARWGRSIGFTTPPDRFQSALSASAELVRREYGDRAVFVIASDDALAEFAGLNVVDAAGVDADPAAVAAVVLGDSPDQLTKANLDRAFRLVRGGAALIGMHRNPWWLTPGGPDARRRRVPRRARVGDGPARRGSSASRRRRSSGWRSTGWRPRRRPAASRGCGRGDLAMVGDDVGSDIRGGRRAGLRTVFVRSGKHGDAELAAAAASGTRGYAPDAVAPSIAEVVAALGLSGASVRRARDVHVVDAGLDRRVRATVERLEPDPDRLAGPGVHARSTPCRQRPGERRAGAGPLPDDRLGARPSSTIARRWSADDAFAACANSQRNPSRWPVPDGQRDRRGADRRQRRRGRSAPADEPAASPVTNAARPDGVTSTAGASRRRPSCAAGLPRAQRPDAGAVSVPSGLTVQPRPTSRSSSNAPQRACRTAAPRTDSGHQARSARYRTASLLRAGLGRDQRRPSGSPGSTSRTCTRRSGTCRTGSRATLPWVMYRSLPCSGLYPLVFAMWRPIVAQRRVVRGSSCPAGRSSSCSRRATSRAGRPRGT